MKKRYFFIALAIIALTVSGILVINKESYADKSYQSDLCPTQLHVTFGNKEDSFINSEKNKITIPSLIYHDANNNRIFAGDLRYLYYYKYYDDQHNVYYDANCEDTYMFNNSRKQSILMGYLINTVDFSSFEGENDYYKQILILWAMDRLAGFDDDINYIYSNGDVYEAPVDSTYDDKYNSFGFKNEWKYVNNLSAGDKKLLKTSFVGEKMLQYLHTWDEYVSWYLNDASVELDAINLDDISYHVTNDYVETGLIIPTSTGKIYSDKFSGYTVNVQSPMVVVDKNGKEKNEFKSGEGFRVRVPISEIIGNSLDYSINISANFSFPTVTIYNSRGVACRYEFPSQQVQALYQQLSTSAYISTCNSIETLNDTLLFQFSQRIGTLNVKVIDSSTGNNLSKAEVTVYDLKGNEVYKYETTDKELNITLPVGEYIVKQTVTPPNYEAQTIQMRVDVTEEGIANAVLENAPLVNVPNTAMTTGVYVIIGGLLAIAGGMIVGITFKKRKSI